MSQFEYRYSYKNKGQPTPYSSEQMALGQAFHSYHEAGNFEWTTVTIAKLECDQKEEHYPDLCWHYLITISNNPTLKSAHLEED